MKMSFINLIGFYVFCYYIIIMYMNFMKLHNSPLHFCNHSQNFRFLFLTRLASRPAPITNFFLLNTASSSSPKMVDCTEPKEITIPIPSGHVAGKVWNEGGIPVLGLHGWMDNAGTWDGVGRLLPKSLSLVSIDFPGHGLSSRPPLGSASHFTHLLLLIERVVQHFGWKEVNLLGHSMGAGASMLYAGTFPDKVKTLIMVDLIKPLETSPHSQPGRTATAITELVAAEAKLSRDPPCYKYTDIVDKLIKSYGSTITEEAAKTLLKRGTVKHPNGLVSFNYDPRLKTPNTCGMSFDQQKEFASRLQCDMMLIKASDGPIYEKQEHYDEIISIYKERAKKFRFERVDGTHHVHLNNPEVVTPLITNFILGSCNDL